MESGVNWIPWARAEAESDWTTDEFDDCCWMFPPTLKTTLLTLNPGPMENLPAVQQVLKLLSPYLTNQDWGQLKLVNSDWKRWCSSVEAHAEAASRIFHTPHIVNIIFGYLNHHERLKSRRISRAFDLVACKYLKFKPIINDVTLKSILKMGSDLRVQDLRAAGLFSPLPTREKNPEGGVLDCTLNRSSVKSLTFYEGVLKSNKEVLIQSFPHLEELKYLSTTNFAMPAGVKLERLKNLHICSYIFDESESLQTLFAVGRFPVLETLKLQIQTRLDVLLYLEVHHFIAVHLAKLKKLTLLFGCGFLFATPDISNMFLHFPEKLRLRWCEVAGIFQSNKNPVECHLKYLRCEGISRFYLSTKLYENLKQLNPLGARLYPDHFAEDNFAPEVEDELEQDAFMGEGGYEGGGNDEGDFDLALGMDADQYRLYFDEEEHQVLADGNENNNNNVLVIDPLGFQPGLGLLLFNNNDNNNGSDGDTGGSTSDHANDEDDDEDEDPSYGEVDDYFCPFLVDPNNSEEDSAYELEMEAYGLDPEDVRRYSEPLQEEAGLLPESLCEYSEMDTDEAEFTSGDAPIEEEDLEEEERGQTEGEEEEPEVQEVDREVEEDNHEAVEDDHFTEEEEADVEDTSDNQDEDFLERDGYFSSPRNRSPRLFFPVYSSEEFED